MLEFYRLLLFLETGVDLYLCDISLPLGFSLSAPAFSGVAGASPLLCSEESRRHLRRDNPIARAHVLLGRQQRKLRSG